MDRVELFKKLHIDLLEYDMEFYNKTLANYKEKDILCSNLAHILYKITTFDFKSNKTIIGKKYHLYLELQVKQ